MRIITICLVLFLAACNQTDDDSALQTANNSQAQEITQLRSAVSSLQAQVIQDDAEVSALKTQMASLQLIGKLKTVASVNSYRTMAEFNQHAITNAVSFGPCADMGVFQGRGGSDTDNPLTSQFEVYKSCTGYTTSYNDFTGLHDVPPYMAWDGPNCTGNAYLETDVPQNAMNSAAVKGGLVIQSPVDSTVYQVTAGQTPAPIFIQSAINTRPGSIGCTVDQETRLTVLATPNTSSTGIPDSLVPGSWSIVSP